ncbi:hypothetical protein BscR1v2_016040 [Bartonella schoenbuchensis R1]|uniref:Uncharacterized protein n=2 Tax=Bartonella schoenbuchensis TaxID=165694 RepID=E6Z1X1_BARSR|nr:hypothetical protein BscR1v2_016040 [Bartonella schoenbuchensis R1]CBI83109.1 conserved exported hypothetical protein [Bartonella schoenbuchensis R1]CDP79281.1 hypothetical protein BN1046_00171 [Bartonella schoenbuchensis]CDP79590.1 hypothetical protein BN1046_00487 [Bartonella schoenbuchensis]
MLKLALYVFFILLSPFATYAQKTMANETDYHSVITSTLPSNIVANYPLTENFLVKMEQIKIEVANLPAEPDAPGTGNDNSIEGLVASVSGRPKLAGVLEKHNITPRDYVIGFMALQATLAAVSALEDNDNFDEKITLSQSNLEFGQKHINRIRALLWTID